VPNTPEFANSNNTNQEYCAEKRLGLTVMERMEGCLDVLYSENSDEWKVCLDTYGILRLCVRLRWTMVELYRGGLLYADLKCANVLWRSHRNIPSPINRASIPGKQPTSVTFKLGDISFPSPTRGASDVYTSTFYAPEHELIGESNGLIPQSFYVTESTDLNNRVRGLGFLAWQIGAFLLEVFCSSKQRQNPLLSRSNTRDNRKTRCGRQLYKQARGMLREMYPDSNIYQLLCMKPHQRLTAFGQMSA
jgi:hypothetical protein